MFRLDQFTFPAACYTEHSSGAGRAGGTLSYSPKHKVKKGNVKPLWEGKRIQTKYGNNASGIVNRVFLLRNDALDLGSDTNTERCNTQGCELQRDSKMLHKTEVRLGLNNRCTEYQTVQPHTEIQILKGAKLLSQFQTVTPRWSRWQGALLSTEWQQLFSTATLAKGLALLTTEGWTIISAVLWPLQFSCEKHWQ